MGGGGGWDTTLNTLTCFVITFMVERKKERKKVFFSIAFGFHSESVIRSVSQSDLQLVFGWTLIPCFHVFLNLSLPVFAAGSATRRKI
jgi:hypothetical protein